MKDFRRQQRRSNSATFPRRFPRFDSWAGDFHLRFFIAHVYFLFFRVLHIIR
nr:MAG TPA: hypothetical protein [Caudoviricetes sp.]